MVRFCTVLAADFVDGKICNENAGMKGGLPSDRLGEISQCEIYRISFFSTSELSEMRFVGCNDDGSYSCTWRKLTLEIGMRNSSVRSVSSNT